MSKVKFMWRSNYVYWITVVLASDGQYLAVVDDFGNLIDVTESYGILQLYYKAIHCNHE